MKKIETVYVAGLITPKGYFDKHPAIDYLKSVKALVGYSLEVFHAGYVPFCPALDFSFFLLDNREITEKMIKDFSIIWLKRCDAMVLTPGWEYSPGTIDEIKICVNYNIPVFHNLYSLLKGLPVNTGLLKNVVIKEYPHKYESR